MLSAKPKRHRKLKNVLVDIDSVTIDHGDNYINWINLTKTKLKKREKKLLLIRIAMIESIVKTSLNDINLNYKISTPFIESVLNDSLYPIISQWNGINILRIKKPLDKFKDYFGIARNWWDINKQQPTASSFWIPVFNDIQRVHFIYETNKRQLNTTNILKHIHIK